MARIFLIELKNVLFRIILALGALLTLSSTHPFAAGEGEQAQPLDAHSIYLPVILKMDNLSFYVDSFAGSDTNPGTSVNRPWKTLAPVNAAKFPPGSTIYFKRGSSWTGELLINYSGRLGDPITFTAYGQGERPLIRNPGSAAGHTRSITVFADWVVVDGLSVRDAADAGIEILEGSDHNIIRDVEAAYTGFGIAIKGQFNRVMDSDIHDLHLVNNTPGGDDDFGAVGVLVTGSNNEIYGNRIENCTGQSYDYGTDGGAIEFFGNVEENFIHHNWTSGNDGFLEAGGGLVKDNVLAYNVSYDNGIFSLIHLSGKFASRVENLRVENNTIIETGEAGLGWTIFGFEGAPSPSTFSIRNNLVYAKDLSSISNRENITHDHNLYFLAGGAVLGFSPSAGELVADPLFADLAEEDFRLRPSSPAINAGMDLGYSLDFDGKPVPVGSAPDIGAFEYQEIP